MSVNAAALAGSSANNNDPNLLFHPKMTKDQEKMAKKSGALWECVKREREAEGSLYTFRYRDEYRLNNEKAHQKIDCLYPAVEETSFGLLYLDPRVCSVQQKKLIERSARMNFYRTMSRSEKYQPILQLFANDATKAIEYAWNHTETSTKNKFVENYKNDTLDFIKHHRALAELGYSLREQTTNLPEEPSGIYLTLPSRKMLQFRWKQFASSRPNLPSELDIGRCEGVAEDCKFVYEYFKRFALLSSGEEFCHDHFFHVIRQIVCVLIHGKEAFETERNRLIQIVAGIFNRILLVQLFVKTNQLGPTEFSLLMAIAGMITDVAFSRWTISQTQSYFPPKSFHAGLIYSVSDEVLESLKRRKEFANVEISKQRVLELWLQVESFFPDPNTRIFSREVK